MPLKSLNLDTPSRAESSYIHEKIEALQQSGDEYTKKIEIERRKNHDLDRQIKEADNILQKTKREMGGTNSTTEQLQNTAKAIRTYENRLEKVLTKYNETCNSSKQLRDEIQNLRREKLQLNQIRERLDRELHAKQQEAQKSAQCTQSAYDARDRAARLTEELKQQNASETMGFEMEWNSMKSELEMDQSAFMNSPRKRGMTKKARPEDMSKLALQNKEKEKSMRVDSTKTSYTVAEKEQEYRKQVEKLQLFEENFRKLWRETGVDSIEAIVSGFLSAEEQNFSLFNMLNGLHTEMEALEVENHKLALQIEGYQGKNKDMNRDMMKQSLEQQIQVSREKASLQSARYEESMMSIDAMKAGILNIFNKVGCNDEALSQQLISTGVTDINLMTFLGILEQRIGEIVQMHLLQNQSGGSSSALIGDRLGSAENRKKGDLKKAGVGVNPLPPATDDMVDSDNEEGDDNIKPYSIAELHQKATSSVQRRKEARKAKRV